MKMIKTPAKTVGVLTFEQHEPGGCALYRHREKNKNQAYLFVGETDAAEYAARYNLLVVHAKVAS